MAAFTSRGIGPFSEVLKVRPEPSLALSGASQVAITDIDEFMSRHSADANASGWLVPLLVVGLVVFVSAMATAALVYVHRQRVKTGNGGVGGVGHMSTSVAPVAATASQRLPSTAAASSSGERRPCKFHLPAALITLTTQSPKFSIKLRRAGNSGPGSRQVRCRSGGDFQLLSNSSTRCSFPATATGGSVDDISRNNTYCSLKRFGGAATDEGEAAFLEVRHRSEVRGGASSAETMWIDRNFDPEKSGNNDSASRKKRHFIYSTMSRITKCSSGLKDAKKSSENVTRGKPEKRLKLRSGILLSDRKPGRKLRRGESEDESDYAYIDRSTHSITGYLNMEAKNVQMSRGALDQSHTMSTFVSGNAPLLNQAGMLACISALMLVQFLGKTITTNILMPPDGVTNMTVTFYCRFS